MYLKELSEYFEQLCEEHVDVAHSTTNRAFCRYQDMEELAQLRNAAGKNIVVVKSFFGVASGEFDDAEMQNTMVLCFSSYAKAVKSSEIIEASEQSFQILLDFVTRMRKDFEDQPCPWKIDWERIQFDEIEQPWLQNHYGWDLLIPYRTVLPAYNENRWSPVGSPTVPQKLNLTFLMRFRVGAPGAPMDGDSTSLTNVLFFQKRVLVLVDGMGLPTDDGSGEVTWIESIARRIEKTKASETLTFIGGVVHNEVIEIFEVS